MTLISHTDGYVHFSDLKQIAKSPAHYKWRCEHPMEATRDMLIGSAVNARVLGQSPRKPLLVWRDSPTRAANAYKAFAKSNPDADILTGSEWNESEPIAEAVLADPVARGLLGLRDDRDAAISSVVHELATEWGNTTGHTGNPVRYEVPLTWTDNGIPCATTGIDIVGPGYLADLKVVHNAEPEYLQKHALRMGWHAQLVWYWTGMLAQADLMASGATALHLLCVESAPPHCVTVLTLSPEVIEAGEKCVRAWMERLKVCAESDCWPSYVQSPVVWTLPEWMQEFGDDDA